MVQDKKSFHHGRANITSQKLTCRHRRQARRNILKAAGRGPTVRFHLNIFLSNS